MIAPKRQARGIKRSSVMKVQRQLILLRCITRAPCTADELIEQVNGQMLDAYPRAARAAFRHDLRALRDTFGCVIEFKASHGYRLLSVGELGLLTLSDEEIAALRFLDSTYATRAALPEHQQVRRLLDRIIDLLPLELRQNMNAGEPILNLSGPSVAYPHDAVALRAIRRALVQRRELRFRYRSTLRPGEETQRVAPVNLFSRDSHVYLLAYCLDGPLEMVERVGGYVDYRVDYMVPGSVTVLPRTLPPKLPERRGWTVRYLLSREIAAQKHVAHWFADTQIDYRPDDRALVTATVYNLWQARQVLLRYLDGCRVLEPPELVAMMHEAAERLTQVYATDPDAV